MNARNYDPSTRGGSQSRNMVVFFSGRGPFLPPQTFNSVIYTANHPVIVSSMKAKLYNASWIYGSDTPIEWAIYLLRKGAQTTSLIPQTVLPAVPTNTTSIVNAFFQDKVIAYGYTTAKGGEGHEAISMNLTLEMNFDDQIVLLILPHQAESFYGRLYFEMVLNE